MRFALNHIAAPRRELPAFFALARALGIVGVEIRNDLDGVPLRDGTPAATVRAAAEAAGVRILTVNALQRFERWDATRAAEADALAEYAAACGAAALVLCPTNDIADTRGARQRAADLRTALEALRPILLAHGVAGYVEPLGFAECALRRKRDAIDAIDELRAADVFSVVHDTFHHGLSGEIELFGPRTGLVHISGVEADLPLDRLRDPERVLVGPADRIDNAGQIAALIADGYEGAFSFEPFSPDVHALPDLGAALRASIAHLQPT